MKTEIEGIKILVLFNIVCFTQKYLDLECENRCPNVQDPVCSVDGVTYANKCKAQCHHAEIKCEGKCPCGKHIFIIQIRQKKHHFTNLNLKISLLRMGLTLIQII